MNIADQIYMFKRLEFQDKNGYFQATGLRNLATKLGKFHRSQVGHGSN